MILEETLNKLIRDIIDLILVNPGFSVKSKQRNAPREKGSYADVTFMTDTSVGWEERLSVDNIADDDVTETLSGYREIMLSIGFYRDSAMDNGRKVRTALFRQSITAILLAAGVGLLSRSDVRSISESLEDGWEPRAQFDIVVSTVGTDEEIVTSILNVGIVGDFQTRGQSIPLTAEVNT